MQAVSSLAAVGSLYAIFRRLRQMERAKREDARHAEAMEALRQQGETLRALSKSLEAAVRGMETVIERMAQGRTEQAPM